MIFFRIFAAQWFVFKLAVSYWLQPDPPDDTWYRRWGEKTYRKMLKLGGIYIKLGQVLSITGGFLPKPFVECLTGLQDKVEPKPQEAILKTLRRSLGGAPDTVFKHFETQPVAAASLGQVHWAELLDGRAVAVKVLYPNIRRVIAADLVSIRWMMRIYRTVFPVREINRVHDSFSKLLDDETHYTREASAMKRMRSNLASSTSFILPEPIDALTTDDVLVMTRMQGFKITDLDAYRTHGISPEWVAKTLVEGYFEQVLEHGFFHADPHPGNFLICPDPTSPNGGRIVMLDFGACATVESTMVMGLLNMIESIVTSDKDKMLAAARQIGFLSDNVNTHNIQQVMLKYWDRLVQLPSIAPSLFSDASGRELLKPEINFAQLRSAVSELEYPEGWFYIERALIILFWLVGRIDPRVDIVRAGLPKILPLLARQRKVA